MQTPPPYQTPIYLYQAPRVNGSAALSFLFIASVAATAQGAFAFEPYQTNPGTRAMGMAGMFVAQADDSSAIWYNPAGPKAVGAAKSDLTAEFANYPTQARDGGYKQSDLSLKFFGGYSDELIKLFSGNSTLVVGGAYFSPYRASIHIDHRRNALDPLPYGDVDVIHHQASVLLAASPYTGLSLGATLDAMWSGIKCRDYDLCVTRDPRGKGASLGAKYTAPKFSFGQISVAAAWHSSILVHYSSLPESGIGRVIGDYIPGRPRSFTLGANAQLPNRYSMVNVNLDVAQVKWTSVPTSGVLNSDYNRVGVGAEAMFPFGSEGSFAVRVGAVRAASTGNFADVRSLAMGAGYAFAAHHAVDLAVERRATWAGNTSVFSVSYSYQQ